MSPLLPLWFPTSLKKSVIIPVPKNGKPSCLNDYRPVALTSTVKKVLERILKNHICSSIPATLDPIQFANRMYISTAVKLWTCDRPTYQTFNTLLQDPAYSL